MCGPETPQSRQLRLAADKLAKMQNPVGSVGTAEKKVDGGIFKIFSKQNRGNKRDSVVNP